MIQEEPIHEIAHLGRVELLTPTPERSLWYFGDVLGMEVVHRGPSAVYLRGYGDHAASTLKLTESAKPGLGCISWRAMSPVALERRASAIEAAGIVLSQPTRTIRPSKPLPLSRPRSSSGTAAEGSCRAR